MKQAKLKVGRPRLANKVTKIGVTVDTNVKRALNKLCKKKDISVSEAVRQSIHFFLTANDDSGVESAKP